MVADIAPDWHTSDRDGTYRIMFDGKPSLICDPQLDAKHPSHHGLVDDDARLEGHPPRLRGGPGIVTGTDLPLTIPTHAFDIRSMRR